MDQHLVADRVAVHVVDLFEAVQVEQQDRMRLRRGRQRMERGLERLVELATIGKTGERVLKRQAEHLFLGGNATLALALVLARAPPRVEENAGDEQSGEYEELVELDSVRPCRDARIVWEDIDLEGKQNRGGEGDEEESRVKNLDTIAGEPLGRK